MTSRLTLHLAPALTLLLSLAAGCGGHDTHKQVRTQTPGPVSGCVLLPPSTLPARGEVPLDLQLLAEGSLSLVFTYSTDGGLSFSQATAALDSPLASPAAGIQPAPDQYFLWDSTADLPGVAPLTVLFRLQAQPAGTCEVSFTLTNASEPTCVLTGPGDHSLGAAVPLELEVLDATGDLAGASVCFSTDGGATQREATIQVESGGRGGSFPPSDPGNTCAGDANQIVDLSPGTPAALTWDAAIDGVGLDHPQTVQLRAWVEDGSTAGVGPFESCELELQVLSNAPPSCQVAPATAGFQTGPVSLSLLLADEDDPQLEVASAWSSDAGATYHPASPHPSSPLLTPALGVGVGAATFIWDAPTDLPAVSSVSVRFQVTVTDGVDPGGTRPITCTTTFAWGVEASETLLEVLAVTHLGDRGSPVPGSPSPGNPQGNYQDLEQRQLDDGVALAAGGSPALLFGMGGSTRPVIEGILALAGSVDLSEATHAFGTTAYSSSDPTRIAVATDGTLTALAEQCCAHITATVTPDPAAVPGGAVQSVTYAACVDRAGVDHATREGRLLEGELDAGLPGLPSGPVPGGGGSTFSVLLVVSTGSRELGAHSLEIAFDPGVLAVDEDAPGTLSGVEGSSTEYGGPTVVSVGTPGVVAFNHFHIGTPVSGLLDLAQVHLQVLDSGTTAITTTLSTLGDSSTAPIGAPTPRICPAATGEVTFP